MIIKLDWPLATTICGGIWPPSLVIIRWSWFQLSLTFKLLWSLAKIEMWRPLAANMNYYKLTKIACSVLWLLLSKCCGHWGTTKDLEQPEHQQLNVFNLLNRVLYTKTLFIGYIRSISCWYGFMLIHVVCIIHVSSISSIWRVNYVCQYG